MTAPSPDTPGQGEADAGGEVGCCTSCKGSGGASDGPCWDCRGTGCAHPEPLCGEVKALTRALDRGVPEGPAAIHFCPWPGCLDIWESEASCVHALALAAHDASVVAAARADAEGRLGEVRKLADDIAATKRARQHAVGTYAMGEARAYKAGETRLRAVLDAAGPQEGEHQAADSPRRPNEAG